MRIERESVKNAVIATVSVGLAVSAVLITSKVAAIALLIFSIIGVICLIKRCVCSKKVEIKNKKIEKTEEIENEKMEESKEIEHIENIEESKIKKNGEFAIQKICEIAGNLVKTLRNELDEKEKNARGCLSLWFNNEGELVQIKHGYNSTIFFQAGSGISELSYSGDLTLNAPALIGNYVNLNKYENFSVEKRTTIQYVIDNLNRDENLNMNNKCGEEKVGFMFTN